MKDLFFFFHPFLQYSVPHKDAPFFDIRSCQSNYQKLFKQKKTTLIFLIFCEKLLHIIAEFEINSSRDVCKKAKKQPEKPKAYN